MNKKLKLLINIILIVIAVFGICYFGGIYISEDQCVKEYIRGRHINVGEEAISIAEGNTIYTIFKGGETNSEGTHIVITTNKIGFLYRAKGHQKMSGDTHNVAVSWFETTDEKGYIVVAERKDEEIARADVLMMLGFTGTVQVKFEEWENNVAAKYVEGEQMNFATYQTYDEGGNLIEDLWGDGVGIAQ